MGYEASEIRPVNLHTQFSNTTNNSSNFDDSEIGSPPMVIRKPHHPPRREPIRFNSGTTTTTTSNNWDSGPNSPPNFDRNRHNSGPLYGNYISHNQIQQMKNNMPNSNIFAAPTEPSEFSVMTSQSNETFLPLSTFNTTSQPKQPNHNRQIS